MTSRGADRAHFGPGTIVGEFCTFGCARESRLREGPDGSDLGPIRTGSDCIIGNYVCIYEGTQVGSRAVIEDRVRIGYGCSIGDEARLMYGAFVCDRVTLEDRARVAGFVCDASILREGATSMGQLVHQYTQPHAGWFDGEEEPAPVIERNAVVAMGAVVVGGIRVGSSSYVAAGAVVTKSVPAESIVVGVNEMTPMKEWSGRRLQPLIEATLQGALDS